MNIVRWNPFTEVVSLREAMDRLFEDNWIGLRPLTWPTMDREPAMDVYQTDNELVVKAALPGVKPEDINVTVEGDTLTIRGETKSEEETKDGKYVHREAHYGSFCRQMTLPVSTVVDKAEARLENGILTLTMPKAEEVKAKQIKVNVHPVLEQPKAEANGKKSKK